MDMVELLLLTKEIQRLINIMAQPYNLISQTSIYGWNISQEAISL
jgi:hypothetical protein